MYFNNYGNHLSFLVMELHYVVAKMTLNMHRIITDSKRQNKHIFNKCKLLVALNMKYLY